MPFNRKNISWKSSRGMVFCALLLSPVIVLAAFGFGRGTTNRAMPAKTRSPDPPASTTFQGNSPFARVEAEHITLRRTGFEPNEITRPTGPFLLAVDNVAGMGEMSFRLLNRAGARVRDFPAKGRFRLRKVVDLPPGRYALVETNHPEWICRITVAEP